MKLRNKKTGEIRDGEDVILENLRKNGTTLEAICIDEIKEEWEDYEEPEEYFWYIDSDCETYGVSRAFNENDTSDVLFNKSIGNYFETREEAEKAVEKLKAWKRLKDKGFRFDDWKWKQQCIDFNLNYINFTGEQIDETVFDLELLFGGEE